jgi:hypothetical protein
VMRRTFINTVHAPRACHHSIALKEQLSISRGGGTGIECSPQYIRTTVPRHSITVDSLVGSAVFIKSSQRVQTDQRHPVSPSLPIEQDLTDCPYLLQRLDTDWMVQ